MNSAGWKRTGPSTNQLSAPLAVCPSLCSASSATMFAPYTHGVTR
jgi:hypothetical protein